MKTEALWFWLGRERREQLERLQALREFEAELVKYKAMTREQIVREVGFDLSPLFRNCHCKTFGDL